MDLKALMGLWGFGARLRSSLQRWHCGEGRWQMACIRLVVVLLGGFQCRYPTWYSFDMFWSSICEGWNHRRPAHMWNAVFLMFASRKVIKITCSWQALMNTCQFGSSLYVMTSRPDMEGLHHFQDLHPNTPPKTKTDLFSPIAAKALCLPETLGTAFASTNLCEVGFFRNLEVEERSWFIMWTKLRDLLRLQNSKSGEYFFLAFYGESLGSETLQDFQGPNHLKGKFMFILSRGISDPNFLVFSKNRG